MNLKITFALILLPTIPVEANTIGHKISASIVGLYFGMLCHEMGHAVAGNIFFNDPIDIQLGIGRPKQIGNKPNFSVKLGLLPIMGFSKLRPKILITKKEKLKDIFHSLAEPAGGALGSWLLKKAIEKSGIAAHGFMGELHKFMRAFTAGSWTDLLSIPFLGTDGLHIFAAVVSLIDGQPHYHNREIY